LIPLEIDAVQKGLGAKEYLQQLNKFLILVFLLGKIKAEEKEH